MLRRSEAHRTASMATIMVVATAAMFILSNLNSCEAAAVVLTNPGGGGNVTYGGGGRFSMAAEEMELEMLMEELYFSVHVSRVLANKIKPGTGTGATGKSGKQACPKDKNGKYNCDPKPNGKNKGTCKDAYCR